MENAETGIERISAPLPLRGFALKLDDMNSICAQGGLDEYLAMQRLGKNVGR